MNFNAQLSIQIKDYDSAVHVPRYTPLDNTAYPGGESVLLQLLMEM